MAVYSHGSTVARSCRGSRLHGNNRPSSGIKGACRKTITVEAALKVCSMASTHTKPQVPLTQAAMAMHTYVRNISTSGQAVLPTHGNMLKVWTNCPTKAGRRGSLENTGACTGNEYHTVVPLLFSAGLNQLCRSQHAQAVLGKQAPKDGRPCGD